MIAGSGSQSPSGSTHGVSGTGTTPSIARSSWYSRSRLVAFSDSAGSMRTTSRRGSSSPTVRLKPNCTLDAPPASQWGSETAKGPVTWAARNARTRSPISSSEIITLRAAAPAAQLAGEDQVHL